MHGSIRFLSAMERINLRRNSQARSLDDQTSPNRVFNSRTTDTPDIRYPISDIRLIQGRTPHYAYIPTSRRLPYSLRCYESLFWSSMKRWTTTTTSITVLTLKS